MGGKYPGAADVLAVRDALAALGASDTPATLTQIRSQARSVAKTKVRSVLSMMKELRLVRELRGSKFRLGDDTASSSAIEAVVSQYAARMDGDREKLQHMALYAQSARCRWKELLDYFGEGEAIDACGTCDNCTSPPELQHAPPVDRERHALLSQ